jgi:hypothetical protein
VFIAPDLGMCQAPKEMGRVEWIESVQEDVDNRLIHAVREVARLQKDLPKLLNPKEMVAHILSSLR